MYLYIYLLFVHSLCSNTIEPWKRLILFLQSLFVSLSSWSSQTPSWCGRVSGSEREDGYHGSLQCQSQMCCCLWNVSKRIRVCVTYILQCWSELDGVSLSLCSDLTLELPFTLTHPKPKFPVISRMITIPSQAKMKVPPPETTPTDEPPQESDVMDSAAVEANLDPRPSVSSVHDAIDHNLITFDTYVR